MPKPDPKATKARRTRRHMPRKRVLLPMLVLLVLALAFPVAQRLGLLTRVLLPVVEARLGCEVRAERVEISAGGQIIVTGLELVLPDIQGKAATFVEAERLVLSLDRDELKRFRAVPDTLTLIEPTLRVAVDEDLNLNLAAFDPPPSSSAATMPLPEVRIVGGTLELGEYGDEPYQAFAELPVEGSLQRDPDNPRIARVSLEQRLDSENAAPRQSADLRIDGEINLEETAVDLRARAIDLRRYRSLTLPDRFQPVWESLAVAGSISEVHLTYSPAARLALDITLDGVALTLPLDVEETEGTDPITVRKVQGTARFTEFGFRAAIDGLVADLPTEIDLVVDGFSLDAPLSAFVRSRGFRLTQSPELLPYCPPVVEKILERFRGPTGTIDSTISIERIQPAPDVPLETKVEGLIFIRDGVASYEEFGYPFEDVHGVIEFNERRVAIRKISASGPTGARLLATGFVEPPGDGAHVFIDIVVDDLPTDQAFIDALPEDRRDVVELLFSDERFDDLVSALERDAEEHPEAEAALEAIERTDFAPGGLARAHIVVERPLGDDTHYVTTIDVEVPDAGILPAAFPYPAIAELFRLTILPPDPEEGRPQTKVIVDETAIRGLTGMHGRIGGTVLLAEPGSGEQDVPDLTLDADEVPFDRLLVLALPKGEGQRSPRDIVDQLNLSGEADASVRIRPPINPASPLTIGFSAHVDVRDLAAAPGSLDIRGADAQLSITEQQFLLEDLSGTIGGADFAGDLRATYDLADLSDPPELSGALSITDLDLEDSIEDLVAALADEPASRLSDIRNQFKPRGMLNANVELRTVDQALEYDIALDQLRSVGIDALGGRLTLVAAEGSVRATGQGVEFEQVRSSFRFNGEPAGDITLAGTLATGETPALDLDVSLEHTRLESAFVAAAIARAGELTGFDTDRVIEANPRGGISAFLSLSRLGDEPISITGTLAPRSLSFDMRDQRIDFSTISGGITIRRDSGSFDQLSLRGDDLRLMLDGGWTLGDESLHLETDIEAVSHGLSPIVRALLPRSVDEAITDLKITTDADVALSDGNIVFRTGAAPGELQSQFTGQISFREAAFSAAADFTGASGALDVIARSFVPSDPGLPPTSSFRIDGVADAINVLGLDLTDAEMRLLNGPRPGQVILPFLRVNAAGGVVSASASFEASRDIDARPVPGGSSEGSSDNRFELHAEFSRIDFDKLLLDLGTIDPETNPDFNPSRGTVSGNIAIDGISDRPATHRGRGTIRIQDGDILDAPGIIPLLTLSNLQIPTGRVPDLAYADFHIRGDRMVFPGIYITEAAEEGEEFGGNFWIEGSGELGWPSLDLDLRFVTRGRRHVPFVSELLQGLRDEIITTRITGPINGPTISYEQFTQTRDLLGSIFGDKRDTAEVAPSARPAVPVITPVSSQQSISPRGKESRRR